MKPVYRILATVKSPLGVLWPVEQLYAGNQRIVGYFTTLLDAGEFCALANSTEAQIAIRSGATRLVSVHS